MWLFVYMIDVYYNRSISEQNEQFQLACVFRCHMQSIQRIMGLIIRKPLDFVFVKKTTKIYISSFAIIFFLSIKFDKNNILKLKNVKHVHNTEKIYWRSSYIFGWRDRYRKYNKKYIVVEILEIKYYFIDFFSFFYFYLEGFN